MTPAKRNEGIQYRERQMPWQPATLVLNAEQVHNDPLIVNSDALIAGAMIMLVEAQLIRIMGE